MNYKHEEIKIDCPLPGRYQITGFRAGSVYIPDVGHLAPPQQVDLAMSADLADALRAVLDDYQPEVEAENEREYEALGVKLAEAERALADVQAELQALKDAAAAEAAKAPETKKGGSK